jgi:predicted dehydrogenase
MNLDKLDGSTILGTKGGLRLDPFGFFRSYGNLDIDGTANLNAANYRWTMVVGDQAHYAGPQQHWVAALQGKVELIPTAELALNTMLISEAIYLSDQRGAEVTAEEVISSSVSAAVKV